MTGVQTCALPISCLFCPALVSFPPWTAGPARGEKSFLSFRRHQAVEPQLLPPLSANPEAPTAPALFNGVAGARVPEEASQPAPPSTGTPQI